MQKESENQLALSHLEEQLLKLNILIEQNSTKNNSLNNSFFLTNEDDNIVSDQFDLGELKTEHDHPADKKFIQDIVLLETLSQLDL